MCSFNGFGRALYANYAVPTELISDHNHSVELHSVVD